MSKIYVLTIVLMTLFLAGCLESTPPATTDTQQTSGLPSSSDTTKPQVTEDNLKDYGGLPQQSINAYDKVSLKTVEFLKNKNTITASCDILGAISNNVDGRFGCEKLDTNVFSTGCSFSEKMLELYGKINLVDCSILMHDTVPGTTYSIRVTDEAGNIETDAGFTA